MHPTCLSTVHPQFWRKRGVPREKIESLRIRWDMSRESALLDNPFRSRPYLLLARVWAAGTGRWRGVTVTGLLGRSSGPAAPFERHTMTWSKVKHFLSSSRPCFSRSTSTFRLPSCPINTPTKALQRNNPHPQSTRVHTIPSRTGARSFARLRLLLAVLPA